MAAASAMTQCVLGWRARTTAGGVWQRDSAARRRGVVASHLLLVFFLALCGGQLRLVDAKKSHSTIYKDDRGIIQFDSFCYSPNRVGFVDLVLNYHELFVTQAREAVDLTRLGFVMAETTDEEDVADGVADGSKCLLDRPEVVKLFTWQDLDTVPYNKTFHQRTNFTRAGDYSLFFVNCDPRNYASFKLYSSLYNQADGKNDYLPSGLSSLPLIYLGCFGAYVVLGSVWFTLLLRYGGSGTQKIHYLMGVLLVFKALTVLTQAGMYEWEKQTGVSSWWTFAFYIFSLFRALMLFSVIILVGSGWSLVKPFLQDREKNVLVIVLPLQVFANIASIVLDETSMSAKSWLTWRDLFHLVDIICCCAILFPIVWSIKHLKEAAATDGKAAEAMIRLTLFQQFYLVVVGYIYATRIVVYLLESVLSCDSLWFSNFANEAITLAFYLFVGLRFRPSSGNPYLSLGQDDDDEAGPSSVQLVGSSRA